MKTEVIDFNSQVCTFKNELFYFAMSFTHNNEDADDLVQDTLLKAIRYARSFKEGTNLRGWLYTILRNTFINSYRRKGLTKNFMVETRDIPEEVHAQSSYNQGVNKCVRDDIYKAMDKLQPEYYTPFIKYFEGYKYHEIAAELNIPIGTVKTRIHMARGVLKKSLRMYQDQFKECL